jgi:hypothetical protein
LFAPVENRRIKLIDPFWLGIADIRTVAGTYHPTDLPLYMLLDMPYNAIDYWAGMKATIETSTKQPDLVAKLERNNLKHIGPWCNGTFNLCTRKPWKSISESNYHPKRRWLVLVSPRRYPVTGLFEKRHLFLLLG